MKPRRIQLRPRTTAQSAPSRASQVRHGPVRAGPRLPLTAVVRAAPGVANMVWTTRMRDVNNEDKTIGIRWPPPPSQTPAAGPRRRFSERASERARVREGELCCVAWEEVPPYGPGAG